MYVSSSRKLLMNVLCLYLIFKINGTDMKDFNSGIVPSVDAKSSDVLSFSNYFKLRLINCL